MLLRNKYLSCFSKASVAHRQSTQPENLGRLTIGLLACSSMAVMQPAGASAFLQRNALDTSALFDPAQVYVEAGSNGIIGGNVHVHDALGFDQSGRPVTSGNRSADYIRTHSMPFFAAKLRLGEAIDCLFDSRMSVQTDIDPGSAWVGRYEQERLHIQGRQNSLTCSYALSLGSGRLRLIAGYLRTATTLDKTQQVAIAGLPAGLNGALQARDQADSRRWGVAYEWPAYALRAVLMYQDRQPINFQGSQFIYLPNGEPLSGGAARIDTALPRTWQLDLQSGIAPGWLATFSANWQRWSELQTLQVQSVVRNGLALYFKDSWMFSAGIGHAFTPQLSLTVNLSYMQGAADADNTRYDEPTLPFSDNWNLGLGGKYQLTQNVALKAGIAATRLSGAYYIDYGTNNLAREGGRYDTSWLYSAGGSLVVTF